MEDTTKGESPVEETPASETQEDAANPLADNPRASIYEKYDAMKAEKETAETAEETPEEAPPEKASATEEKPKAEPDKDPETEELTPEQFKERFKNVKVKGKFAGEEAVVSADDLLRLQGVDRHYTKSLQELAREREALREKAAGIQPSQPEYVPPIPEAGREKSLRYWNEGEVEQRYNDLASESPYRANQFLEAVKVERGRAQEESRKARMDTAERDFFALNPAAEPLIKDFFADTKNFSDPRIAAAFERGDYYGALEIASVRIESQAIARQRAEIKVAQEAAIAEEKKKIDLKRKGSVLHSSTKTDTKPPEEFRPPTPSETIAAEAARRRALMNR